MQAAPEKMVVAHLATVDLSLRYLLLPQLEAVVDHGGTAVGISAPGDHVAELEARGIRHIPLKGSTRRLSPIADMQAMFSLWRALQRVRPDVLHTHTPKPGIYGRILGRLAGTPVVINTNHGLYALPEDKFSKRLFVYLAEACAARFSDFELIQSREDYELLTRWRLTNPKKTLLLGNGVDLQRFRPDSVSDRRRDELRHQIGASSTDIVVGSVGRLVTEKGFPEIFQAARQLGDGYRFVVIGPREPEKNSGLKDSDLRRAERSGVKLIGMQDNVEEWYAAMDIFVLASHREGFPRAAMEAAAMGLPIIASDVRGCREVVDHEITGLLTPVRDPKRLTEAIRHMASSHSLRERMGLASAEKAKGSFDQRRVIETVLTAQVLALRKRGYFHYLHSTEGNELEIRSATQKDAPVIAALHRRGISTGFLSTLGLGFLSHLYAAMIEEPGSKVLLASDKLGPVAFIAGVPDVRSFYKRFFRNRSLRAALSAGFRLVRPSTLRRMMETALYDGHMNEFPAELLAMAVAEPYRGRGIGRELAQEMLDEFAVDGIDTVRVVVGADNYAAHGLYSSVGFVDLGRIEVHKGEPSVVMIRRRLD